MRFEKGAKVTDVSLIPMPWTNPISSTAPMPLPPAEIIKRQANAAFITHDYRSANALYTYAMNLDPNKPLYVLNRATSNLKLTNWEEAEKDATLALSLFPADAALGQKALFRRSRARKAQGDDTGAQEDLKAFVARGGKKQLADAEALADPFSASAPPAPIATSPTNQFFEVKDTALMGKGAFATRAFHRGDMIFAEKPLISLPEHSGYNAVLSAVERLSPSHLVQFLSLQNSYDGNLFIGIYRTNSLPGGLCITASQSNHSCVPNARYSWHADSGRLRVFALTEIAIGEEICVSYLASRNVYGRTRDERRRRIVGSFNFVCSCTACTLDGAALEASDARRREVYVLWETMTKHDPRFQGQRVLRDAVRAIRLLQEEGYAADADDFAQDAAAFCAMHSDWESAKYWAKYCYDCRCAEFGVDNEHSRRAKVFFDDPHKCAQAGMYSGQKFPDRV
ncbi:hypothetical protein K438DRAFT_1932810 [Mycena galopus ATCC 62051]|nr:hypothetical protein K438DRAFT_1932810 [Mycena galopus ATCC 62051]